MSHDRSRTTLPLRRAAVGLAAFSVLTGAARTSLADAPQPFVLGVVNESDTQWTPDPKNTELRVDKSNGVSLKVTLRRGCSAQIMIDGKESGKPKQGPLDHENTDFTAEALKGHKKIGVDGHCGKTKSANIATWTFGVPVAGNEPTPEPPKSEACKASGAFEPLRICSQPNKAGTRFRSGLNLTGELPPVVNELVQIFAEIAVDKAKRKGFELIRTRIVEDLCTPPPGWKAPRQLPRTCALIETVRLQDLGAQAQALQGALVADLLGMALRALPNGVPGSTEPALSLVQLAASMLEMHFQGGHLRVTLPDPKLLIDKIAVTHWQFIAKNTEQEAILTASLEVARECVAKANGCDISALIHDVAAEQEARPQVQSKVVELAGLLVATAVAVERTDDVRERWRLGVEVMIKVIKMAQTGDPKAIDHALLDALHDLFIAIIDEDLATAISRGSTLLIRLDGAYDAQGPRRAMRVVTTIGAYAATYRQQAATVNEANMDPSKGTTKASTPDAAMHEARKKLIEDLVDEMTDRRGRDEDRIWSLGADVAFVGGGQWVRESGGSLGGGTLMAPQISLPIGLAYDVGLSKRFGVHLMLYPFDVGQFAAYKADQGVNKPRWDTFLAAGGQVGIMTGQETPFVFALDVRYAPSLFAQTNDGDLTAKPGGALRVGLSVGYYVPFFDFN
jgi:hypothetical protein